ncbi:M20 family metallopeptidase [Plantactinospora endophytica]|uniref:Acetylornithine deacetylase n=1 Tax=Plantactinospora endophytica TaxID=673535 RepID=A0ABQ4E832_9ACTN|nr:M20/M25/M40 family metallo-hydrolase [Plantactinospora endophytica]GIG90451.1 acetylornithine deacetylase [Plantactinospora endophytica]
MNRSRPGQHAAGAPNPRTGDDGSRGEVPTGATVGRIDSDAVLAEAARLIAIEGHQDHPGQERAVADHVADRLRGCGAEVEIQPVADGRANVIARLRGSRPGPTLMLNAHLDTVPPYAMPDALLPRVADGRLWGRGAVDMKGALAAMIAVVELLAAPDVTFDGELLLTGVAGEENGSPGMRALVEAGIGADFAVVGEPTMLRVGRAHKGAMWAQATFRGVATHGSVPQDGVNAVYHAARFVNAVEQDLVPALDRRRHPLLGPATVNVGVVAGGDRPPMVPASCTVQLDRRWLPSERHDEVLAELRAVVAKLNRADPQVDATVEEMAGTATFVHAPLDCPPDDPYLRMLCSVAADPEPVGLQFWTDAALLAATGTPAAVCGPGDIAQAHSLAEWVLVDQLRDAAEVYRAMAERMLSVRLRGTGTEVGA